MRNNFFITILIMCSFMACSQQKERNVDLNDHIQSSVKLAATQYKKMNQQVPVGQFPRTITSTSDDSLITTDSGSWTSGFYPGSLWYLYEFTQEKELKKMAMERTESLEKEKTNDGTHDIGFMIYCSYGNGYRITGDSAYTDVMMTAAKSLTRRYDPDVQAIRSWGDRKDQEGDFTVIIDNMMNLELLFWATKFSGDSTYANIAEHHADKTIKNHFRKDGSSYHVVEYDPQTGDVISKHTAQGYADSSAWARGQAWALYGYTMSYRETDSKRYLDQANKIAHFILDDAGLPEDKITNWDFDAPKSGNHAIFRDASAAAIMASALLELSQYVDSDLQKHYKNTAKKIITTLSGPRYRSQDGENANFLLKHSVGHKPADSEVNVPIVYADYYYLEAMMRWQMLENGKSIPMKE